MAGFSNENIKNREVVVIGSGTLGRRVALVWSAKGGAVTLVDSNGKAASDALAWVKEKLPTQVKNVNGVAGKVSSDTNTQNAVKKAWMVVECIPEIQQAKVDLLGQLDEWCPHDTIIATISSSFKSADLAEKVSLEGRRRLLNTHYFQPPELPPVEIMSSGSTEPAIIEFLVAKLRDIGLQPIVAQKQSTGLIYNRVWAAMKREVMMVLAEEVGKPEDIDLLFRYCFQSKGAPCQLMDNVGLQTVCNIEEHYIEERGNIPRYPVDFIRKEYVDKGNTGTNSGKGLFDHTKESGSQGDNTTTSSRSQLIGAWELVDYHAYLETDESNKIYPMGKNCQGIILYTPNGYMSAQLQIPGQAPYAINDLNCGTEKEHAEAGKNYLAYTGPYYLDTSGKDPVLKHHMTTCSFPNWLGNTQRRMMKITEEDGCRYLTLAPDSATDVGGEARISILKWKRLPDNYASKEE